MIFEGIRVKIVQKNGSDVQLLCKISPKMHRLPPRLLRERLRARRALRSLRTLHRRRFGAARGRNDAGDPADANCADVL